MRLRVARIIKLYPQKEMSGKGMVIRITDRELIAKTGGIVQGMSGSPRNAGWKADRRCYSCVCERREVRLLYIFLVDEQG